MNIFVDVVFVGGYIIYKEHLRKTLIPHNDMMVCKCT